MSNSGQLSSSDPFYLKLISRSFPTYTEAIVFAKDLSLKYGFIFHQEQNQVICTGSGQYKFDLLEKNQGWEFCCLDLESRTKRMMNLCAQLCMLNAGSEDLSHHLEGQLTNLLQETAHVDPISLYCPLTQELTVSTKDPVKEQGRINSLDALPNVIIPQHTMYIKTYNQALTGDIRRAIYEKQSKAEVEWSYPQTSLQDDKSMYTLSHPQELYLEPFVQGNQMNETLL